jgi:hypothetical protein
VVQDYRLKIGGGGVRGKFGMLMAAMVAISSPNGGNAYADEIIAGTIVGFDCGEAPAYILIKKSAGNVMTLECSTEWCKKAANERPSTCGQSKTTSPPMGPNYGKYVGKKIRAKTAPSCSDCGFDDGTVITKIISIE